MKSLKLFLKTLWETFITSLPLAAVIIIVCVFVAPMRTESGGIDIFSYVRLAVGYAGVVVGQAIFLIGLDVGILSIGKAVGESLDKVKRLALIVLFGFLFGFLATLAEPAVIVFARQTNLIMPAIHVQLFVVIMAAGIGGFVGYALYRVMKNVSLKAVFVVSYILIFVLAFFVPGEFIALAFDGSGATTGDISVPFMLALGFGVCATVSRRQRRAAGLPDNGDCDECAPGSEKLNDSTFGIIGIASIGPILTVFIYGLVLRFIHGGELPPTIPYDPGANEYVAEIIMFNITGVALALLPVMLIFIPFQLFLIKMPRKNFVKILLGIIPVYIGLLIFLASIDFGFAFAGSYIGEVFLGSDRPEWFRWILLAIGFVLGMAITLSEPAVTVLGEQLEGLTGGKIKRMTIRMTLAIGIGFASVLAIVKILTELNILWFLIPLYIIALIMMKFTSKIFVGLAFDSGGVAGGALTSAFLTPLTLGIAQAVANEAEMAGRFAQSVLMNGFGIIAFISITPMIAVQILGMLYAKKMR